MQRRRGVKLWCGVAADFLLFALTGLGLLLQAQGKKKTAAVGVGRLVHI